MKSVSLKALAFAVLCASMSAQSQSADVSDVGSSSAKSDTATASVDLPYRHALYEFHKQRYEEAKLLLDVADKEAPLSGNSEHRKLLEGKLNLEMLRYEDAQIIFDSLLDPGVQQDAALGRKIYYPLAELNFAKGSCDSALKSLEAFTPADEEEFLHTLFMRISCQLDTPNLTADVILNAESQLLQYLEGFKEFNKSTIWLSYSYYNLAAAAGSLGQYAESDRYYTEALKYTGITDEGKAMADRIRLSLAYLNLESNRFDFAMSAFAQLRMEGLWIDQSLLGYGWSAFNNYKPGVALETWRQLINLPFKSLSVYEGYIAIPFVLEKANAYSEALKAYQTAIGEYDKVVAEIDQLTNELSIDRIHEHALEYAESDGEQVEPLHGLLVSTYAQEDFRIAVERIGEIALFQQRLDATEKEIAILAEAEKQGRNNSEAFEAQRLKEQSKVDLQLRVFQERLAVLVTTVLDQAVQRNDIAPAFKKKYREYKRLSEQAKARNADAEMLSRLAILRGVLLWELHEEDSATAKQMGSLSMLLAEYQQLNVRYNAYRDLERKTFDPEVTTADIQTLKRSLESAKEQGQDVLLAAEQQLLQNTLAALLKQRASIENYKRQARIASARLKEEFFQRGGRQLWR